MINFKKCTIFFMCILLIFGVVGMVRQCYSLRKATLWTLDSPFDSRSKGNQEANP